jgi:hypothetical protein
MRVVLGNRDAAYADVQETPDGLKKTMVAHPEGKRATVVDLPDEWTFAQCFRALTDGDGVFANNFTAGATPAWVAADDAGFAQLLSSNFGGIEIRELLDPYATEVSA